MEKYQPLLWEKEIYQQWEKNGYFQPNNFSDKKEVYSIVIPPPNVTGYLHIGHALVNSLQDIVVRRKRMQGYQTLWLPGTDHAGIATQMIVEKHLRKQGIERKKLGKEKFVKEVWKWKHKHGNQIYQQLKRLGASLDWSRERFTLDEGLSLAVKDSFIKLYNEGLIYRGEYLVNWCPQDQTALSDLEVEHKEVEGEITQIRYPLLEESGFIEIATTRPETLLGDSAIAVHPEDERYKKLIGKKAIVPLVEREIPILADSMCDPEFGTGAVKITPAHDHNDFSVGKRHQLQFINIFTEDAKINEVYPPLQGLDRFVARKKVIESLKEKKLWINTKKHLHSLGYSQRSKVIVEPRLSTQWFCKMKELAKIALKEVEAKKIVFFPSSQKKIFREWLENIQDWCISRQLWWGHPIPAWHCLDCKQIHVTADKVSSCQKCGSKNLQADNDVLDTWYSSGLFPFSTMGWPEENAEDFKKFYPTSSLITGYDILFFWVARMIMLGLKLTNQAPFQQVFLHGLVRDAKGEKMSKTKGNVIDPLEIIEKHGADSLRFALCSATIDSKDLKLPEQDIIQAKFFINKLWNASNFVLFHLEKNNITQALKKPPTADLDIFTKWIIKEWAKMSQEYHQQLDQFRFFALAQALYHFLWGKFCDWYLEITKPMLFDKLGEKEKQSALFGLCFMLEETLKLLHPICPFVTEKIWQKLPTTNGYLIIQEFRKEKEWQDIESPFAEKTIALIEQIRAIKGENNLQPKEKVNLFLEKQETKFSEQQEIFSALAGIKEIHFIEKVEKKEGFALSQAKGIPFMLDLKQQLNQEGEKKRLTQQLLKIAKRKNLLESKLQNSHFLEKAPAELVEANKQELEKLLKQEKEINEQIESI